MKKLILISAMAVLTLCSCTKEAEIAELREGWLGISSVKTGSSSFGSSFTKGSVPDDMVVNILRADGTPIEGQSYAAGQLPSKIRLAVGDYKVETYSANRSNWRSGQDGKGAPIYYGIKDVSVEAEKYNEISLKAGLENWGVRFKLADGLNKWFTQAGITVIENDNRSVTLQEEESVWFDAVSVGIKLTVTNTDGHSYTSESYELNGTKGHRYTINYNISPDNDGTIKLDITLDDQWDYTQNSGRCSTGCVIR
ncbi:MAG: DUF4493 domain-containing protein [Bacteroidales bacterium]|nr:DUF4493 domain-containing protein [Candidatus Cryptobacteroides equifaecalis]